MAHIREDRILESTTGTGIGAIATAGAVAGFRRFSAVCAVGDTVPYFIEALDSVGVPTGDYEYGVGTYSSANTITRTKVLGSSNAGALVNFAAGSKNIGTAALGGDLVPTGASFDMTGSVVPTGYVEADGTALSRAAYPGLWSYAQASGNIAASDAAWASATGKYSPGDGATTFRVPDARGEFVRAWDHGKGTDSGRAIGSNQLDAMQGHFHGGTGNRAYTPDVNTGVQAPTGASVVGAVSITVGAPTTDGSSGTPRTAAETRSRSIAWMKIIKT